MDGDCDSLSFFRSQKRDYTYTINKLSNNQIFTESILTL